MSTLNKQLEASIEREGEKGLVHQDKRSATVEPSLTISPMQELQMQIVRTGDLARLKELMALEREWKADHAKEAYNQAMAKFKAIPLTIRKNKHVKFDTKDGGGKVDYWHATLASICEQACPLLASVGLRHHWDLVESQGGVISVTCTLTHQLGHSESVALSGLPDASGKKNPIQQKGSTVSYLERYTFLAVTGLATLDQDDDGRRATPAEAEAETWEMESGAVADFVSLIEGSANVEELWENYDRACIGAGMQVGADKKLVPGSEKDAAALTQFTAMRRKRAAQLEKGKHA